MTVATPAANPWFLVGLPGSGKTHVGKKLAEKFSVPFIDTDELVEAKEAKTVSEIFDAQGEEHFRELEQSAILGLDDTPGVVALGGGAIVSEKVRNYLADKTVVWLDAADETLLGRVEKSQERPLLGSQPDRAIARLRTERTELYRQVSTVRVSTTGLPAEFVVRLIIMRLLGWNTISVEGGRGSYEYYAGAGVLDLVPATLPCKAQKAFVVVSADLEDAAGDLLLGLESQGLKTYLYSHLPGEEAKQLDQAEKAWTQMGAARIGRDDVVVALGGGVTTDLAGFLAATWLRGINLVQLPSSLLAMVDAAVGGKTGVNTEFGKNLIGAFYDPNVVLADLALLRTLPEDEYRSGLAEVVKAGFVGDPVIIDLIVANPQIGDLEWATGEGAPVLGELVERAVQVKVGIVEADRLESGSRAFLNYGHTLAHAIERAEDFAIRHGEAVAIGMMYAAYLGEDLGITDRSIRKKQEDVLRMLDLPVAWAGDLTDLEQGLASDKKRQGSALRFIVLEELGRPQIREVSREELVAAAERFGIETDDD